MLTFLLAIVVLCLILPAPAAHALLDKQAQQDGHADPSEQTQGVYITSLRDFDVADGSFGVDYWIWSVHPPETDPLDDVEFVNAKQVDSASIGRAGEARGYGRGRRSGRPCCTIGT
jgi:hypothetical protein